MEPGTKVKKVGDNNGSHGAISMGTILTISGKAGIYYGVRESEKMFLERDLKMVPWKVDEIRENILYFQKEADRFVSMLQFAEETSAKTVSETEFNCYNTLKIVENSELSTKEKAKAISSLFVKEDR